MKSLNRKDEQYKAGYECTDDGRSYTMVEKKGLRRLQKDKIGLRLEEWVELR